MDLWDVFYRGQEEEGPIKDGRFSIKKTTSDNKRPKKPHQGSEEVQTFYFLHVFLFPPFFFLILFSFVKPTTYISLLNPNRHLLQKGILYQGRIKEILQKILHLKPHRMLMALEERVEKAPNLIAIRTLTSIRTYQMPPLLLLLVLNNPIQTPHQV